MSSRSTCIFHTPDGRQWVDEFLAANDGMAIVNALDVVTYVPEELCLKPAVCQRILAAAEVVAAGCGRPGRYLPWSVCAWLVAEDVLFSPGVIALAWHAVKRVRRDAVMRALWLRSGAIKQWRRATLDLQRRLQG